MVPDILWWHWGLLGLVLMMLELLAPGAFFIWLGCAGLSVAGLVALAPDLGFWAQLLVFASLAVASSFLGKRWFDTLDSLKGDKGLNRRGDRYVGQVFTLTESIVQGRGRLQIEDSFWTVEGDDLPKGAQVSVVAVVGLSLKVVPYKTI